MKFGNVFKGLIVLTIIGLIAGCGSSGDDSFGSNDLLNNVTSSSTTAKISEVESLINTGTSSSYVSALNILRDIDAGINYTTTPEEKLVVKTGIKYCEIQTDVINIEDTSTSTDLEAIINAANTSSTVLTPPDDTFFILAASYFAQGNETSALAALKNLGTSSYGTFNSNFTYESEFGIATNGDSHAFMALLFRLNGQEQNALVQQGLAEGNVSSLGADYLAEFENLGL